MLDYWKLWIEDPALIETVLNNNRITKDFTSNEDGTLIGIKGKFQNWTIETLSPIRLQITGSIHKYWNGGTNENDFTFLQAIEAIERFCRDFELIPSLVYVINLEFGVNLQLHLDASEIIEQILCFNYKSEPIDPYGKRPDCYFVEYKGDDYYLKIYDKGKQYRKLLPDTPNTLRIEIKAMNSRHIKRMGIATLEDFLQPQNLQVLALKFAKTLKGLVFDDDTINQKELNLKERKLYRKLDSKRFWKKVKGNTTSTIRNNVNQFKRLVEEKGKRKIYSHVLGAVEQKIIQLSQNEELAVFLPNTYTWKNDKKRVCLSCGRDITQQHKNSRFCSAKYVGEREAKRCRNQASNPRNNQRRKIERIMSKGVLFDITPYIMDKGKNKGRRA